MKINDLTSKLPIHSTKKYDKRKLDEIDKIVIHHSATTSGSAEAYARYHVEKRGWPGIGYHFVIEKDGEVNQTNELKTISYHASGHNSNSIGICLTGNFDTQNFEGAQKENIIKLIQHLNEKLGKTFPLIGHRDVAAKSCPGDHVDVDLIAELVKKPTEDQTNILNDNNGAGILNKEVKDLETEILKLKNTSKIAVQIVSDNNLKGKLTAQQSLDGENFIPHTEYFEVDISKIENQLIVVQPYATYLKFEIKLTEKTKLKKMLYKELS